MNRKQNVRQQRQSRQTKRLVIAASAMSAGLFLASRANAANYTWIADVAGDASGSWPVVTNWNPNLATATTAADTVWFTGNVTVDSVITLDTPQLIGRNFPAFPDAAIVFGDANPSSAAGWTINATSGTPSDGTNVLTLDADPPDNVIYELIRVNALGSGKVATINARMTNNSEGGLSLAKTGEGTLVLTADNSTLTGAMAVNQGVLVLDFSQAWSPVNNILGNNGTPGDLGSSHLQLQSGTLLIRGKAGTANSQTFSNGTGFELGVSKVAFDVNGATSTTLNMGSLSRNAGGVVDIELPSSGAVTWSAGAAAGTYPGLTYGSTTGTNGLLVDTNGSAFATVNGATDWAADSGGSVVAASSIGGFYTASTATTLAGNADLVTDTTLAASASVSSLRSAGATPRTIDAGGNTLSTGGLLITPGSGAVTIQNGDLNATSTGPGGDLIINQYSSNDLTITANITNAPGGTSVLTKNGPGKLIVSGNNTYSGNTLINGGVVEVTGGTIGTLATGDPETNIEIAPAYGNTATLTVSNGVVNADRFITGGNSGNFAGGRGYLIQTGGTINSGQWFSIGGQGNGTFNISGGSLNANVSSGTQMEVGLFGNGRGTVNLSGTGNIRILNNGGLALGLFDQAEGVFNQNGGTVTFYSDAGTTVGGTAALTVGQDAGTSVYNLNGGVLNANRITHSGTGTGIFNFNGGTLRPTQNNGNVLLGLTAARVQAGGAIIDTSSVTTATARNGLVHDSALGATPDGGLTKNGTGTLRMAGVSNYTGATSINAGTLQLLNNTAAPLAVGIYSFDQVRDTGGGTVTSGELFQGYSVLNTGSGGAMMNGTVNHADNPLGDGNQGTVLGTGKFGNGLVLDGLGSSVDIANQIVDQSGGGVWTLSAWVKTSFAGSSWVGKNAGSTSWATGHSNFYLGPATLPDPEGDGVPTGNLPTAVRFGGGWLQGDPSPTSLTDDAWHMVTVLNNGATKAIYVDGVAVTQTYTGFDGADTSTFTRLGFNVDNLSQFDATANFAGTLDEMKFFNVALSAAQITQLYTNNTITLAGASAQYLPLATAVNIPNAGAALDLNSNNQIIGSLAGVAGSNVYLTGGVLTTGGNNTSTTYAGVISGTGGITKTGTGTQTLAGANTYTGRTTVLSGKLVLGLSAHGPVLTDSGDNADVVGGRLIFDYNGGSTVASQVLAILDAGNDLATPFASGKIFTSNAANSSLSLGWKDDILAKQVSVAWTYNGDTNLDGQVTISDLGDLASNWQSTTAVWANGDFNYDGQVTISDLGDLASNWQAGVGSPLGMSFQEALAAVGLGNAAVPEPTAMGLLVLGACMLKRTRRS